MTFQNRLRPSLPPAFLLSTFLLIPLAAYPQTTLTGAMWFATNSSGGTSVNQALADGALNTIGGDRWWDLWLALNPDATSPVNGPSDAQSSIAIPLQARASYKYYIFGQGPCCNLPLSGLNLFFDGNNSNPGISVFGPVNSARFLPNGNRSTFSLQAGIVPGARRTFYYSVGVIVVLTGFEWNGSGITPLNVCQEFAFSPSSGNIPSSNGSFSLQAFPAATVTAGLPSGSPGTDLTLTGIGFGPTETIQIHAASLGSAPIGTATTDAGGSFVATVREPQHPYGSTDFFALGETSGALGAVSVGVTPGLIAVPESVEPGGTTTVTGSGFAVGETVSVYFDQPRLLLGTVTVNDLGSFVGSRALQVTIPLDALPGLNGLVAIGQNTNAFGIGKITIK